MRLRHTIAFLGLAAGLGFGCHHELARAAGPTTATSQNGATATAPPLATVPQTPAPFATPPMLPGTPDVATLAAAVKPAVVTITTVHEVKVPRMRTFGFGFPFGFDPFGDGAQRRQPGGEDVLKQQALGSGFLVDPHGYIVTNAHVVENADQVHVKLADDREFDAKVKGRDKLLDLAVLELIGAPSDLPVVSLGASDHLRVGDYVVAVGNPFGLSYTVTMGIVSAKGRTIGAGPYDDFIQTDASINPGNSGGPLFDLRGQVVGINTAINPNGQGIGFAIPVDTLKQVLPQLITTGRIARGRLGVIVQPVNQPLAKALGLDRPKGALVGEVESGGPADKAGLKAGDLIVSVDGTPVQRSEDLPRIIASHPPESKVKVQVLRSREAKSFDVTLAELRDARGGGDDDAAPSAGDHASSGLGIEVGDAQDGGAIVERVLPEGPADGELAPGDVIIEANRRPVVRAEDLKRQVVAAPAGQPLLLKIRRDGKTRFVAIEKR
jgi:serine protease Do